MNVEMTFLVPEIRFPLLLLLHFSLFGDSLSFSTSIVSLVTIVSTSKLVDKLEFDSVKKLIEL